MENSIDQFKESHPERKGLNWIGACISTVTVKGGITTAISYSIYSQSVMGAEEYIKSKRGHWGIENSRHWKLDIGFRENENQMRAGNAAKNVNVLHHIGINFLKQEKNYKQGIASKRQKYEYDPDYLYKVFGGLNTSIEQVF